MKWIAWEQVGPKGKEKIIMPLNRIEPNPDLQYKWNKLVVQSIGPNYWQYEKSKEIFKATEELL